MDTQHLEEKDEAGNIVATYAVSSGGRIDSIVRICLTIPLGDSAFRLMNAMLGPPEASRNHHAMVPMSGSLPARWLSIQRDE